MAAVAWYQSPYRHVMTVVPCAVATVTSRLAAWPSRRAGTAGYDTGSVNTGKKEQETAGETRICYC